MSDAAFDRAAFLAGAAGLGFAPGEEVLDRLAKYAVRLLAVNEYMNLTAITDPREVAQKHFADSLAPLALCGLETGASLADVGTGAGFPGLVLAILRPDLRVTLLDSLKKRLVFLDELAQELGLTNVRTCHLRAEEAGIDPKHRERYDLVTARALAALPALCEYTLPLCRVGGRLIALKGPKAAEELADAQRAIPLLGGGNACLLPYTLPDQEGRALVVIEKLSATPTKYPRQRVKIPAKPL